MSRNRKTRGSALAARLAAAKAPIVYLDRVFGGVTLIALHEADSLQGHLNAAHERLRIARRARSVGELLRDQVDLFPESRNRLRRDHQVRRELWRGLARDMAQPPRRAA